MTASIIDSARVSFVGEQGGTRIYGGTLHPQISVGSIPFGGYLLSVIISACEAAVKDTPLQDAIHVTAYFLQACQVGPCQVHVRFLKSGKAFHNIEALLVQNGATRITAHLIFGRLGPAFTDDKTAPPMTLTPATSLYRRTPVCHPGQTLPFQFPKLVKVGETLRGGADNRYAESNQRKADTPNDGQSLGMNGVLEFGGVYQFVHEHDELTQVTIPIISDLHRSTPAMVQSIFPSSSTGGWYPTMVLSIEFKHKIPRGASFSRNMAALYSQGRFLTEGRHDVLVEIWTAPPGTPGQPPSSPPEDGWREKMVCIAVATQMSLTMSAEANQRRGKQAQASVKL